MNYLFNYELVFWSHVTGYNFFFIINVHHLACTLFRHTKYWKSRFSTFGFFSKFRAVVYVCFYIYRWATARPFKGAYSRFTFKSPFHYYYSFANLYVFIHMHVRWHTCVATRHRLRQRSCREGGNRSWQAHGTRTSRVHKHSPPRAIKGRHALLVSLLVLKNEEISRQKLLTGYFVREK